MKNNICVLINVRDRPTELALLLQSLRTQTMQNFDVFILDDRSGTPITNYHFFNCIYNVMRQENHKIFLKTNPFNFGVSKSRQEIVDFALKKDYDYFLRVDDDVILQPDYIERLLKVIEAGYDIASGITTPCTPSFKRDPDHVGEVINRVVLDKEGKHIFNGDDCGIQYTKSKILPAHHFRSCALIKRIVHENVSYLPTKLSKHGFREEQVFSYRAIMKGYKIGVDTSALNYHQLTPSGGERSTTNMTGFNQQQFEEFTKENKDELRKHFPDVILTKQELMKQTNTA